MTIRTLLVANRGEIARRIIRTARSMGVRTVAVYSDADREAPHVQEADAAYHIGPAEAVHSYLDGNRIIEVALRAGADAVHPGYGFLSESAGFAEACEAAGVRFVGPPAEMIRLMGSKIEAKGRAVAAGVPVVPGYNGEDQSDDTLCAQAERIGFPLLVKASAGGGGRGMRIVQKASDVRAALAAARSEAQAGFGDASLLLERYVEKARHIEVQVLGDAHGNVVHAFERDCSLQRNHQKVIEEAPAPGLPEALRQEILTSAVQLARFIGYQNAGTVEYLLDDDSGEFFFLEMNTRLQVEHPVTEAVTGLDLVECQIRVAGGAPLGVQQHDIACRGWAIEARVAAEDPAAGYCPETGVISAYCAPETCRTDSGVETGSVVSHHYDSMLAKVIAHAGNRRAAIERLAAGLSRMRLDGLVTNLGFLADLLRAPAFQEGRHHTGTISAHFPGGWRPRALSGSLRATAVLARYLADRPMAADPWHAIGAWRAVCVGGRYGMAVYYLDHQPAEIRETADGWTVTLTGEPPHGFAHVSAAPGRIVHEQGGQRHAVDYAVQGADVTMQAEAGRFSVKVETGEEAFLVETGGSASAGREIRAPMPGLIVELLHAPGATLSKGDPVVVIEAMKLLQTLTAPCDGVLSETPHQPGETVQKQSILAVFDPEETPT
ncbi:MAG: biotin carboxylase N-terminal domain-containing protein [Sediminimonas sp.]|uniref:acetyl/propionyl/methylcrotonyl-CoA carboxylase subunit alpha n=1 Tax=Sediminimonas sp. TaxID=2823379 RepID=UPI00287040BF|nr:biotin carboxylase N-terminal domain-containing protein [Sediminimonas sp.]MDR9484429.1 biotin carboxylase N-terminal domain-containing protein [Sediminimonas sp.]